MLFLFVISTQLTRQANINTKNDLEGRRRTPLVTKPFIVYLKSLSRDDYYESYKAEEKVFIYLIIGFCERDKCKKKKKLTYSFNFWWI